MLLLTVGLSVLWFLLPIYHVKAVTTPAFQKLGKRYPSRRSDSSSLSTPPPARIAFTYDDPPKWGENFPTCNGQRQSPVAMNSSSMFPLQRNQLTWTGYDKLPLEMSLTNNGHSVQLLGKWESNSDPFITGGPLVDEYVFGQLHFHWGANDRSGAEHSMHGYKFPLEMHLVHYKRSYGSVSNAAKYFDGITVAAILFTVKNQTLLTSLDPITNYIPYVVRIHSSVKIEPFKITDLGGIYTPMAFLSYSGSFTTPPCSEVVTWIIPVYAWPVMSSQLSKFRSVHLYKNTEYNNRPEQPLNGRNIYYYNS